MDELVRKTRNRRKSHQRLTWRQRLKFPSKLDVLLELRYKRYERKCIRKGVEYTDQKKIAPTHWQHKSSIPIPKPPHNHWRWWYTTQYQPSIQEEGWGRKWQRRREYPPKLNLSCLPNWSYLISTSTVLAKNNFKNETDKKNLAWRSHL